MGFLSFKTRSRDHSLCMCGAVKSLNLNIIITEKLLSTTGIGDRLFSSLGRMGGGGITRYTLGGGGGGGGARTHGTVYGTFIDKLLKLRVQIRVCFQKNQHTIYRI